MTVRDLTDHDLTRAVEVLVAAFDHDPALRFLLPDDAHRARVAPTLARTWLRYAMRYGRVWTTPNAEGIAVRRPPGAVALNPVGVVTSGMIWLPFLLGFRATFRLIRAGLETDARHARALGKTPHWYCWLLAVHPDHQGEGHGGRLIAHTFAQADADGVPCYLETSSERALSCHVAHGWRVVEDGPVSGTGLPVWSMVRQPA